MRSLNEIKLLLDDSGVQSGRAALIPYLSQAELSEFGFDSLHYDADNLLDFNRNQVLDQLRILVAKGFKSALNQRGISAGFNFSLVRFLNWVLNEGLGSLDCFEHYGLPLFKQTALKYGFDNPIGDDEGNEEHYSSYYGED